MRDYGESISVPVFEKAAASTKVLPGRLKGRVRVYCDVDGVVKPFFKVSSDSMSPVTVFDTVKYYGAGRGSVTLRENTFWYYKDVVAELALLAAHPDVDFVWLTAWRQNAPYALDELLGIRSAGWLDWSEPYGDVSALVTGKGEAIRELHKVDPPEAFAWVEDEANRFARFSGNFLNIMPDSSVGLTLEEVKRLREWADEA